MSKKDIQLYMREIVKSLKVLSRKQGIQRTFEDFLSISAIEISNIIDSANRKDRENIYKHIQSNYTTDELKVFTEIFEILVDILEINPHSPTDVLGQLFHMLELHDKYKGQFFTPSDVCNLMGEISIGDKEIDISKKGYVTVDEPCCGSGATVLGFANAIDNRGLSFQKNIVVTATDIDIKCVHMTYIQLSLYGIPAVIIHGDTLTVKEWSRWYTPMYLFDHWLWREPCGNLNKKYVEDEILKQAMDPNYASMKKSATLFKEHNAS